MKISYPEKGGKESDLKFNNSFGRYLISSYNTWHGGIHIEGVKKGIHAIADGRIIAYRFTEEYIIEEEVVGSVSTAEHEECNEDDEVTTYNYSNCFILLQHDALISKTTKEKDAAGNDVDKIEKKYITFYSLYNHLMSLNELNGMKNIPEFLKKEEVKVAAKNKLGSTIKIEGLNARVPAQDGSIKWGRNYKHTIKVVIPNGELVEKCVDKAGNELKKGNWSKVKYKDPNGTTHEGIYISTNLKKSGAKRVEDLGSSYQILTTEDKGDFVDQSLITEDKRNKEGALLYESASKDSNATDVILSTERIVIEEKSGNFYKLEGKEGFCHKDDFKITTSVDKSKVSSENEGLNACDIPIKSGELIGYTGAFEHSGRNKYATCQLDVFMADGAEDFLDNCFEAGSEEDKKYMRIPEETTLLNLIERKIETGAIKKGLLVDVLEFKFDYVKIKIPKKYKREISIKDIHTPNHSITLESGRKLKAYSSTNGYDIINFEKVNKAFDGMLTKGKSKIVYVPGSKTKTSRTVSFKNEHKMAGEEIWMKIDHLSQVPKYEIEEVRIRDARKISDEYKISDYFCESEPPTDIIFSRRVHREEELFLKNLERNSIIKEEDLKKEIVEDVTAKLIKKNWNESGGYYTIDKEDFDAVNACFKGQLLDVSAKLYFKSYANDRKDRKVIYKQKEHDIELNWMENKELVGYRKAKEKEQIKIISDVNEVFHQVPKHKEDQDESALIKEALVDFKKAPSFTAKDTGITYKYFEFKHTIANDDDKIQRGWIDVSADYFKKNKCFSVYDWKQFGFKYFEAGNEYIYDIEGICGNITTESPFIKTLWDKIDTISPDGIINNEELDLAYGVLEIQQEISKMVCNHKLEWAYDFEDIKQEVTEFYDYIISLFDESLKSKFEKAKEEKLKNLKEKVTKLAFWDKLQGVPYSPEPEVPQTDEVDSEAEISGGTETGSTTSTRTGALETSTNNNQGRLDFGTANIRQQEANNTALVETPEASSTDEAVTATTTETEEIPLPERKLPYDNNVQHFHPIAFINHMKLIFGGGSVAENNSEAKIRAFLRVIKKFEGIPGEDGYTTLFGGKQFSDMSKHPEDPQKWYTKDDGTIVHSSAAGSYQIMQFLWWEYNGWVVEQKDGSYYKTGDRNENKNYAKTYGIKDFSPKSQDEYCIAILLHQSRSANKLINYLLKGFFTRAIEECASHTWASFTPGRFKNQGPTKGLTDKKEIKDARHNSRVKQWEAYDKYLAEELAGQSDLHLEPGFLKKFGIKEPEPREIIENKKPGLDFNKVLERLNKRAGDMTSTSAVGKCAKYVRWALEAGGMKTWGTAEVDKRPNSAKDYGPFLLHKGFKEVEVPDENYQIGDISVVQNLSKKKKHGHIGIWNGENWVSDFVQRTLYPGDEYREIRPTYKIYRWE